MLPTNHEAWIDVSDDQVENLIIACGKEHEASKYEVGRQLKFGWNIVQNLQDTDLRIAFGDLHRLIGIEDTVFVNLATFRAVTDNAIAALAGCRSSEEQKEAMDEVVAAISGQRRATDAEVAALSAAAREVVNIFRQAAANAEEVLIKALNF